MGGQHLFKFHSIDSLWLGLAAGFRLGINPEHVCVEALDVEIQSSIPNA